MRKYILTLAVLAAAPLPGLAMAADAEQANAVVAAGAVQLSDEEMDNVSAAGLGDWFADVLGWGQDRAPGQKLKSGQIAIQTEGGSTSPGQYVKQYAPGQVKKQQQVQIQGQTQCPGNSCNAPGQQKKLEAQTLGQGPGKSGLAPGRNK
jgi:hypothetical protein